LGLSQKRFLEKEPYEDDIASQTSNTSSTCSARPTSDEESVVTAINNNLNTLSTSTADDDSTPTNSRQVKPVKVRRTDFTVAEISAGLNLVSAKDFAVMHRYGYYGRRGSSHARTPSAQRRRDKKKSKSQNVLLSSQGHLKISDFGLSVRLGIEGSATAVGTANYISPEMCKIWLGKGGSYGFAHDWWSYGAIICELLTLQPLNSSEESSIDTVMKSLKRPVPYGQLVHFSHSSVVQIIIHVISILDFSWRRSRPHHWLSSQKRIKTIKRKRDQNSSSVPEDRMGAFIQPLWSSYRHHTESPKRERTKIGWR
jgi:Protein kinase domain